MKRQSIAPSRSVRRRADNRHANAFAVYGVLSGVLVVALTWLFTWKHLLPNVVVSWLVAINVAAFMFFAFDKLIAGRRLTRVPENVLLAVALAGGSPAALLAMRLMRHKTAKRSFLLRMAIVLAAQVALLAFYVVEKRR